MGLRVIAHLDEGVIGMKEDGTWFGSAYNILKDLGVMTNLTVHMTGFKWNDNSGDPFMDDLVPLIARGQFDVAGSFYYFLSQRAPYLTPLIPCSLEKFKIFYRQPHFSTVRNLYLEPFESTFLYAFLGMSFLIFAIIFSLLQFQTSYRLSKLECFRESVWWMVAFYNLKNYSFPPVSSSLKILILTASLFFTLIYYIYSAFLISSLTSNPESIRSVQDLVNRSYTFYTHPSLKRNLLANELYKSPQNPNMSRLDSFKLALAGGHAHIDHPNIYPEFATELGFRPDNLCSRTSSLSFDFAMSSGFYVSKTSLLKEPLNLNLVRLGQLGLLHRYNEINKRQSEFICHKTTFKEEHLRFDQVSGPFMLLVCYLPFVITIFLAEYFLRFFKWNIKAFH